MWCGRVREGLWKRKKKEDQAQVGERIAMVARGSSLPSEPTDSRREPKN